MKKIAILSGGTGNEIEIAKKSANFFKKYLNKDFDYYELPLQMDVFLENREKYDLAIPVFHGEYGEDGKIFAFLDIIGIKQTFSPYNIHSLCLDKFKTNILVSSLDVNIPKQYLYKKNMEIKNFPQILKPNKGGSSFYTYKVSDEAGFEDKIKIIQKNINDDILVQQFISGDEYSISLVAGEVLPIMKLEKKDKDDFFDYESKYENESKIKETWPEIEKELLKKLQDTAKKIYSFFNIKGFCRIDFIVSEGEIYFLEINTIPGMTEASILPKPWKISGKNFEELVSKIICS